MANTKTFPIVGIGASAGGVEALAGFFRPMPIDTGMAFIVAMHLPIGHDSTMPEILARVTKMPVSMAKDGKPVEANHVYVCPADSVLTVQKHHIRLEHRSSPVQSNPINVFLSSLALDLGENAIGVILSGAGSDGALGLKAIKERGGLTIAQGTDGSGPKQSSMPDTAIATGVVDLVVPVEEMAGRLVRVAQTADELDEVADTETPEDLAEAQRQISRILQSQIGHDFSGYKVKTFMRRVRRRMHITQTETLASYIERLQRDPEEVTLLFRDLLIGVTNFFRDKDAFDALQEHVVPRLFEGLGASDSVRIWVPGCATGEEAYSLAILMREHLDALRNAPKVQIFATDIDDAALAVARAGRYPKALLDSVPPHRLERFFTKEEANYVIAKSVRDLCVFSSHSVVRDPPFSRIDLISCRNLLIYLGTEFQERVIPVFHFALRPGGFLFLGTSESIGQYSELFQRIDRKQRLFQRRDNVTAPLHFHSFRTNFRTKAGMNQGEFDRMSAMQNGLTLRRSIETRVLDQFAPAHVVVNRDGDVLHYSARTGKYLEAAAGTPSRQLLSLARRGLRLELRAALQEAMETRRAAARPHVRVEVDERVQLVDLTVEPIGDPGASDPLYLVLFSDAGPPFVASESRSEPRDASHEPIERELRDTRERLQATVEEYETALEELKAANEEMVSVNEELQSTNEELETSKEELQSVNEELQTVNLELNGKIDELDRANADLRNLFDSTRIALIFLDTNMVIRSFTLAATSIFNLISTDRGRPLTDIVSTVDLGELKRDIKMVFERGETIERRVRKVDGSVHYLMRVLPYRGRHDVTEGVIVTFVEVTKLVEGEAHQRALTEDLNHRVRNMLAIVSAVATQTLNRSASLADFKETFSGRLQAMAKSHNLLSREEWSSILLKDILSIEFDAYRNGRNSRIALAGPDDVAIRPGASLALGMVLHELTTNAAKHGALSNGEGKLSVEWEVDEDRSGKRAVVIHWKESKGPPVKAPRRGGFGSELIDREIKGALRGAIVRDFAATGFKAQITIPLDSAPPD